LGSVLDTRDQVHWSLDGWDQSSNIQYRVNSRWDSIMAGYQAFSAINQTTYKIWATIAFRFNQDHLENIRNMAQDLGFDCWQLTKSTKFNSHYPLVYGQNDALCPTVDSLVSRSHRFEREYQTLSPKLKFDPLRDLFQQRAAKLQQIGKYSSLCMIGTKGVFVNSRGELYPCCWTANRYPHNQSWHDRAQSQFNLYQRSWSDIANDEFWTKDFLEFDAQECQTKCTKEKLQDQTHVTEW
jgi:MoaA/NifB/PqqE/SkfB family radical SAM enzyme